VAALLDGFWEDNSARGPADQVLNAALVSAAVLQDMGLLVTISPYSLPDTGVEQFRDLLSRHVDFDRIDVDTDQVHPMLLLGAVDVVSGRFRAFNSHRDRITADTVIASAAIPNLFRAVHVDGGSYWDGLFSQNPPVRDLLEVEPDELWVIQINPQTIDREPRTLTEIRIGATSCPATCRSTRSWGSSRRSTACSPTAGSARATGTSRSPCG
jgi:NTE family protein